MCSSYDNNACQTEFLECLSDLWEVFLKQSLAWPSQVIATSEVSVGGERFFSNLHNFVLHQPFSSVQKADQRNVFASLLELKKSINYIVAPWSCVSEIQNSDLFMHFSVVVASKLFVQLLNRSLRVVERALFRHEFVLNLNEVSCQVLSIKMRILLADLLLN